MSFGPAAAQSTFVVEIYPYEGGKYAVTGGQIIRAEVTKSIVGVAPGKFELELAPGGPDGPESTLTWSEIITPQSFVLIGGQRGNSAAIIMAGVVTEVAERQQWQTSDQGSVAARRQLVQGQDFTWFFDSFNYYALTFFGLTAGTALGLGAAGLPTLIGQGLIGGSSAADSDPARVAKAIYTQLMVGPAPGSEALMQKTTVPYQSGSRNPLYTVLSTIWELYSDVFIPVGDFFWATEGTWTAKFATVLPAPFYEFFVTTAPAATYASTVANATSNAGAAQTLSVLHGQAGNIGTVGKQFTMSSLPAAPAAGPVVVARVKPTPNLMATAPSLTGAATLEPGLDMTRWQKLPLYDLSSAPFSFFSSQVTFESGSARNFYIMNPTWLRALFGDANTNQVPFMYYSSSLGDARSISRYGFRPEVGTTRWMADLQGNAAQNPGVANSTVAVLTAKLASWWHPQPFMAQSSVTIPFSPDVLPGGRFRYNPFKGQDTWDFYIEAIGHSYVFGGMSTTTLALTRGLPTAIYANGSAGGLLEGLHLGTVVRCEGAYVFASGQAAALPALTEIHAPSEVQSFLSNISQAYVTPQSGQP